MGGMGKVKPLLIQTLPLDQLEAAPYNPRRISAEALAGLKASVRRFGLVEPIVWNKRTKHVVGGHQRIAALREIGQTEAQVVIVDLPAREEKALNLALNNPHIAGEFTDGVADLVAEIGREAMGLVEELRLDQLVDMDALFPKEPVGETDPEAEPNRAEELREKWGTETGQLWAIGEHRVLCGDSTKGGDVERLMGGERASVVTDPPYGISVVKSGKVGADFGVAKKGKYQPVIGDESPADVSHLLDAFSDLVIWGGNYFADQLPISGSWWVWDKRGDTGIENTFADCEIAWTNVGGPARIYRQLWNGMIREGERGARFHPTQKPVALMEWCIPRVPGGLIYDPFLGSGTTIVASQNLGRKAYGIEISPAYVAVTLERLSKMGLEPRLVD